MYRSRFAFALAMAALAAILLPSSLPAQITFERTYGGPGGDEGWSVQQTADGGYVIAGDNDGDVYLVKTNARGDTSWTRTYSGGDCGYSVQQTSDGGYIVTGVTGSGAGGGDVYLVKTDAAGDTLWTKTFGGAYYDDGQSVRQTRDSGYIITGATTRSDTEQPNVCLIKTDANGNTLWTKSFGGTNEARGYSVEQTEDGGFIIAGNTLSGTPRSWNVYLVRTTADGDTLWSKTFGDTCYQFGFAVTQTPDGGFAVAGGTNSIENRNFDVYLIRTNSNGDTLWTRTYGGTEHDISNSMHSTPDGGFVLVGYTRSFGAGDADIYLIRTDADGDTLWTRTYGGPGNDQGHSVQQPADGGYICTGTQSYGASGQDVYLIKTDSMGNVAVAEPKASPTRAPALALTCEPNPSSGTTRISFTPQASSSKPLTLRFYDALGTLVLSQPVRASSFIFHPSSLPSGAYFLRLGTDDHQATTRLVLTR